MYIIQWIIIIYMIGLDRIHLKVCFTRVGINLIYYFTIDYVSLKCIICMWALPIKKKIIKYKFYHKKRNQKRPIIFERFRMF